MKKDYDPKSEIIAKGISLPKAEAYKELVKRSRELEEGYEITRFEISKDFLKKTINFNCHIKKDSDERYITGKFIKTDINVMTLSNGTVIRISEDVDSPTKVYCFDEDFIFYGDMMYRRTSYIDEEKSDIDVKEATMIDLGIEASSKVLKMNYGNRR